MSSGTQAAIVLALQLKRTTDFSTCAWPLKRMHPQENGPGAWETPRPSVFVTHGKPSMDDARLQSPANRGGTHCGRSKCVGGQSVVPPLAAANEARISAIRASVAEKSHSKINLYDHSYVPFLSSSIWVHHPIHRRMLPFLPPASAVRFGSHQPKQAAPSQKHQARLGRRRPNLICRKV
jgi:hypothetical protein